MGIYSVYPAVYFFGAPKEVKAQVNFMSTGADLAGTVLLGYPDVHVTEESPVWFLHRLPDRNPHADLCQIPFHTESLPLQP